MGDAALVEKANRLPSWAWLLIGVVLTVGCVFAWKWVVGIVGGAAVVIGTSSKVRGVRQQGRQRAAEERRQAEAREDAAEAVRDEQAGRDGASVGELADAINERIRRES